MRKTEASLVEMSSTRLRHVRQIGNTNNFFRELVLFGEMVLSGAQGIR